MLQSGGARNSGNRFTYSTALMPGAALMVVVFLVAGWIFVGQVHAQVPIQIVGSLRNGTHDAPVSNIANVPVTLFQVRQTGPVTTTLETDAQGKFTFTNVITDATAYFARV